MKKIILLCSFIIAYFVIISGCSEETKSDCTKGSNNVVTENRGQASVKNIVSNSPADIVISDQSTLSVTAEDNLLSYIATEVSGSTLTINLQGGCIDNHYPFKVIAPVAELNSIKINGEGNVTTEKDINTANLTTDLVGAGNVEYKSGNVNLHQVKITGSGSLEARDLVTQESQIVISGSGNCYVNAERQLTITITGSGNVFYNGSPNITLNITGTGKVTKL